LNRPSRRSLLVAVIAAAAMLSLTAGAHAATYKRCALSESYRQPASGKPTYNLALKHQRTTCAAAKRVAQAFHRCRETTSATCTKRLLSHWTCTGRKTSSMHVLFYARFTCKWGVRRVMSSYQQNT